MLMRDYTVLSEGRVVIKESMIFTCYTDGIRYVSGVQTLVMGNYSYVCKQ